MMIGAPGAGKGTQARFVSEALDIPHVSSGHVPYGFGIDTQGRIFVSEAEASGLSSYRLGSAGDLTTLSASISNGQAAACWAVVTGDGRFVYTANAMTGTAAPASPAATRPTWR